MADPLDVLAFSPHPDDAELGCGGSLLLGVDSGLRVGIAELSAGERSTRGEPAQRQREASLAASRLGLAARFSLHLPDTGIGLSPAHRDVVAALVREARPRVVLSPYWHDRHPDHEAASRVVRDGCFLAGVGEIGIGEPHRPDLVLHYAIHHPVTPSFVVDVTSVWDRKLALIAAYESQFGPGDGPATALVGPAFMEVLNARAVWFGSMIGAARGEPFVVSGPLRLTGLPGFDEPRRAGGDLPPRYRSY
jgi:bacillithiol biosynthesis deacetylase BshB1